MSIRDEELVAFLLGQADEALQQRIATALMSDEQLAERFEEWRLALGLLDPLKPVGDLPPSDLVSRTLAYINSESEADRFESAGVESADVDYGYGSHVRLRPVSTRSMRSGRQFWDSSILSVCVVGLCCLMLPLLLQARSQSRTYLCAENLRSLGRGLTQFAMLNPEHRFPAIQMSGLHAFAGSFVWPLKDSCLLDTDGSLVCPSRGFPECGQATAFRVPTREEYSRANADGQAAIRVSLGGTTAYTLGVMENGRVTAPRLVGRGNFPIIGDAPIIDAQEGVVFVAHEGRGSNYFFEDGHVGFVSALHNIARPNLGHVIPCAESSVGDLSSVSLQRDNAHGTELLDIRRPALQSIARPVTHDDLFRNDNGRHAPGVDIEDAVLGPSSSRLFPAN